MRSILLLICAATVVAALAGGTAHGAARPSVFFADSSDEQPGRKAALELFVSFSASAPATEGLTIVAPSGYTLPAKPIGGQLGLAAVSVRTETRTLNRALVGAIMNADPATLADDPVLRACAPGPHAGVWQLMLLGATPATVPIAVDELSSGGSYKLTICLDALREAKLAPVRINLGLVGVQNPPAVGVYGWSALVTPFDAAGQPDFTSASELRGNAPLPQLLTVKGSYDPKTKLLTARGTLLMGGKPRAGVRINVRGFAADNASILYFGSTRTTRTGSYTFRRRFSTPPRLLAADVEASTSECRAASTAPKGCTSESLPGADSGPAPVAVVGRSR